MADSRMEEKRKYIFAFRESLLCLEDEGDRADIMRSLKEFQTTMLVEDLVDSLKRALVTPQSLTVYVTLYPLIPGRLRAEYRSLIPKVPTFAVKIIRIRRNGTEPLGFTVRGGREHQLGIFITNILPDSRAHKSGLKPGYQILKINAFPLKESTHEEAVCLLTLKRAYILTCKDIGMIPEIRRNTVHWTYATDMESAPISRPPRLTSPFQTGIRTVHCELEGGSFGCSIKGGAQHNTGIFIHKITPGSKAEELGLQVGDEIIEVNGKSFANLTHVEAVNYLKTQDNLIIKLKPGNAMFHSRPESYQSGASLGEDTMRDWRESTGGQFILKKREMGEEVVGPKDFDDFFGEGLFSAPVFGKTIEGYGPTMALPGLTTMITKPDYEPTEEFRDGDDQAGYPGLIADVMRDNEIRRSISNFEEVIASAKSDSKTETVDADISAMLGAMQRKQLEEERQSAALTSELQIERSAGQKEAVSSQQPRRKAPTFKGTVDIIGTSAGSHMVDTPDEEDRKLRGSVEEVLEGRKQVLHAIPKDGPLKFSIQGGTDTVHGGRVLISHIQDGGAAHKYGQINVGDQILRVEGESLLGVTHEQAAMAIKTAMASNSRTLNLLLAQIPEGDTDGHVLSQI